MSTARDPSHVLPLVARRLAQPPRGGWSPPALPGLIARIDAALAARRG